MSERDKFPYVACWDFDETLGRFHDYEPTVGLRHGIRDVLQQLKDRGFHHFITTSGKKEHVLDVIIAANLTSLIDPIRIWPRENVVPRGGYGKEYHWIEEGAGAFFYDETQTVYPHKMLAIGNSLGDRPVDVKVSCFFT